MRERWAPAPIELLILLLLALPPGAYSSFAVQGHVSDSTNLDGAKGVAISGSYL